MTKKEFLSRLKTSVEENGKAIYKEPVTLTQCADFYDAMIELVIEDIVKEGMFRDVKLGRIKTYERKPRTFKAPSGKVYNVPTTKVAKLSASKLLKSKLNPQPATKKKK